MKKRVFQFVDSKSFSGLENVVIHICTLVKGYDYTYVSPSGIINNFLKKLGIKHINISSMNPISVGHVIRTYKPDIVHGHDVKASLSLALNSIYCKIHHIKIISQLHSDDPKMRKPLSLRSLLYTLSSFCYNRIILVSRPILNDYYYKNLIKSKTIIIHDIITSSLMSRINNKNNFNKKWDCIFLGRLDTEKRPSIFIKMIYYLKNIYNKNIKAVIVGDGFLRNNVKYLIDVYHLNNNIQWVGFQTDPYIYLKESKVLVMPSEYEGYGLSALESLIMGVPVIASPAGGLKDIVDNNCGGFATSINVFSDKVKILLSNKKYYMKQAKNAKIKGKSLNNIDNFIKKYKKVYG